MKFVTNGVFAIPLIPECRLSGLRSWANTNKFAIVETFQTPKLDFIIPYRNSYDRIIRAIGADLHEVMLDAGVVNLNKQTWTNVKDIALPYIINWFDTTGHLPIKKNFCHTGYLTTYLITDLPNTAVLIDISTATNLTNYIKTRYNLSITNIPENSPNFYDYTVPYWEIDRLYKTNENTKRLIDIWCAEDDRLLSARNFLISS